LPTYGYECTACKEQFEVFQKMTDAPLAIHEDCGGELRRLLYPVGIVFKGPGFYVNDYARGGKKESAESKPAAKSEKADAAAESKPETKTETKTETKAESTSAAKSD
jgi:putative FmdB family regulatory protein